MAAAGVDLVHNRVEVGGVAREQDHGVGLGEFAGDAGACAGADAGDDGKCFGGHFGCANELNGLGFGVWDRTVYNCCL